MNNDDPSLDDTEVDRLRQWIGNTEMAVDSLTEAPVSALSATLDRDDPQPVDGAELPPLWHWLYFLAHHRQSDIGADGHPKRGGFLPPVPLPRRMWAGGRLAWEVGNPLRIGQTVQRHSRIQAVTHKRGRSGDLVFVVVRHELINSHGLALSEEHDIVYKAASQPDDPTASPIAAPTGAMWQRVLTPDEVLLFRYSSLTFNGHRIHYDRRYITDIEPYLGLVVHGPLIATLLVDLFRRQFPDQRMRSFEFKAVRPCFDGHALTFNGQPTADGGAVQLWAHDQDGFMCMRAGATLA